MQKKVSVIIPTYRGSESLKRAIDSVLSQDYDNFEVIVIDDNDPTSVERVNTEKIVSEYKQQIKYIKHTVNMNGAVARNTGIYNSDGEYICFLDDDDIFLKDKLKKQVSYLEEHPEYGAVYCWRYQQGEIVKSDLEGDLSYELLSLKFTTTTCALMIRREIVLELNGFDETFIRHQDFEFMLRYYEKYKIGVVKEGLIEIIGNRINNQVTGKKLYSLKEYFFSKFKLQIDKVEKKYPGAKRRIYAAHFARAFEIFLRHGNLFLAIKCYFKYGIKGGTLFWEEFFFFCKEIVKRKLKAR